MKILRKRDTTKLKRCARGATLVEAALVMFLFFLFIIAFFEYGVWFYKKLTLYDSLLASMRYSVVETEAAARGASNWVGAACTTVDNGLKQCTTTIEHDTDGEDREVTTCNVTQEQEEACNTEKTESLEESVGESVKDRLLETTGIQGDAVTIEDGKICVNVDTNNNVNGRCSMRGCATWTTPCYVCALLGVEAEVTASALILIEDPCFAQQCQQLIEQSVSDSSLKCTSSEMQCS